jgi:TRAP-type C4-dicarboxylate transport system permease small subunit
MTTARPRTLAETWPVRIVRHALEVAVAAVVAFYAGMISVQVFYRYVLNSSLVWSEEIVRYSLLWGVMLGAALAADRQAHIALDPLRNLVTPPVRVAQIWLSGLLVVLFCGLLVWYGYDYAWRVRFMRSPAAQFPMKWAYAAIPVGGGLTAFFVLVHLISGTQARSEREARL